MDDYLRKKKERRKKLLERRRKRRERMKALFDIIMKRKPIRLDKKKKMSYKKYSKIEKDKSEKSNIKEKIDSIMEIFNKKDGEKTYPATKYYSQKNKGNNETNNELDKSTTYENEEGNNETDNKKYSKTEKYKSEKINIKEKIDSIMEIFNKKDEENMYPATKYYSENNKGNNKTNNDSNQSTTYENKKENNETNNDFDTSTTYENKEENNETNNDFDTSTTYKNKEQKKIEIPEKNKNGKNMYTKAEYYSKNNEGNNKIPYLNKKEIFKYQKKTEKNEGNNETLDKNNDINKNKKEIFKYTEKTENNKEKDDIPYQDKTYENKLHENGKKTPTKNNINNDKKDIFKYVNNDKCTTPISFQTIIRLNEENSSVFIDAVNKIKDEVCFVNKTHPLMLEIIQKIMNDLSQHITKGCDKTELSKAQNKIATNCMNAAYNNYNRMSNILYFLWNIGLIDKNSNLENLNDLNEECRKIILKHMPKQENNKEVFLGKYQCDSSTPFSDYFNAYGTRSQDGKPTVTRIELPDGKSINVKENLQFTYKNASFTVNPIDNILFVAEGENLTPLKFFDENQQNPNPYVQSSNNAQGYGQGRASEPDKCINDFHKLNSEEKIDVKQQEIKLENNPKYIFRIEKQAQCSENLQKALEKAGIEKEQLSQLNNDCYAIYAYEIKDGNPVEDTKRLVYEGQIKDGKMSGLGQLFLLKQHDDEEYYAGEFKDGKYNGKGFYQYSKYIYGKEKGDSYKGEFKNGEKHGKGVYNYSNGLSIDEEWSNGVRCSKGIKDHSKGSPMQADVFVFDFAGTVSIGYNTKRYAAVGRIVSKEVAESKDASEDFKALKEQHDKDEAENEKKWTEKIDAFIEQAKTSDSKVLKIVLNVHGSNGSNLWLNDNHWDGLSFAYLLNKINDTPELKDKNIEIINCSCHQSHKFLFEEIQNHLDEMSKYFSIPNHVEPHITLPKDIDKKIEKLEENENKKELFNTLRAGETFKRELLRSTMNAEPIEARIQNAENLEDLYCKIFPAVNVMVQVNSVRKINIKSLNSNSRIRSMLIIMSNLSNVLGADDQQHLSKDEIIRQNTAKRILLQLDDNSIAQEFKDFNEFFKDVLTNKGKHADLHEKCKNKTGEELFNVVFEAFVEQQKTKIIKEKSIKQEDIQEVENVFYRISTATQSQINKEMNQFAEADIKKINDKIKKIMDEHNQLVDELTQQIVNNPDKIDENQFVEKKKEILNLKQTIFTTIDDFFSKEENFDNITQFLEKYKNDEKIKLPTKAEIIEAMKEQIESYNEKITAKFNATEKILDYVFKYKRIYKQNYITDLIEDFAKKHCERNNEAEVIYSEDINPDDVHYTIKKQKDDNNPLSVSNQQILLEYKKFNKKTKELETIIAEEDKGKYDAQRQQFLERIKQYEGVQKKDNPKETEEYHYKWDIHNESLNMLEMKNRSKKLKNELLYGEEIFKNINTDTRTVSMIESKEEEQSTNEINDINNKDNNNENKQTTFGGQEIISAQTNQKILIPEFTESDLLCTKQGIDDSYTLFLGNSKGKDGEKQSLFLTQTNNEENPLVLTYIEEDKNGQKNYWTYNSNKNETINLMNDGMLRICDNNQGYLRQLQLFPAEKNKDKKKIDFQNVSRECLEKMEAKEQEKSIYGFYDMKAIIKEKIKEEKNLAYKIKKSLESQQERNPKQHKRSKSMNVFLYQLEKPNDPENQEKEEKQESFWCGYHFGNKAISIINVSSLNGEAFITSLCINTEGTEGKEIRLLERKSKMYNESVKLTYQKVGEKGKIIIKTQKGTNYECKLDKDAQLLIESCLNNEKKENKKIENGEKIEIDIDAEKFEEIFDKKREEKEFKIKDLNYKDKTLQFLHDEGENITVCLYDNKIFWFSGLESLEVTLTYQKKEGRKGTIIMKLNNKNISFPLDEKAQEIIESCISEGEKKNLEKGVKIDTEKFEKIFDKKREEKEFKIKDCIFALKKALEFSFEEEHGLFYKKGNQIFNYYKQEVTLAYQKKEGRKGRIIIKCNNQIISYPLNEEAQKIIESCISKEQEKEIETGKEINIDATKFEEIFDKKREEKEFKIGNFRLEEQHSFLKKPTVVLKIRTDDNHEDAHIKIKDKIVSVKDLVSVEINGVTLMYQKATEKEKGKIIVKHNDNLVSYPINSEGQEVIEKFLFFDEEDRKKLTQDKPIEIDIQKFRKNIIQSLNNEKNNEQLDEEKSLELSEAKYYSILSNDHYQNLEGLKFSNNHGDDWFVLQNGAIFYYDEDTLDLVPVELKYKPGEIIIKYYDAFIPFSLKEETQTIIEKYLSKEEKEKLEKGEEINIDAGKFKKIFETKKEEKFAQKQENEITINNTLSCQTSMAYEAQQMAQQQMMQLLISEQQIASQQMMQQHMMQQQMRQIMQQRMMQQLMSEQENNNNMKNTEMNEIEQKSNENNLFNKKNESINNSNELEQNLSSSSAIIVKS